MLACNITGLEKLKPVIIKKSKGLKEFKAFNKDFYCKYLNNNTAWMTSADLNRYIFLLNGRFRVRNRKILLILYNCLSHKITCELTHIELLFLPKNSTSKLQPLDAGIIRSFVQNISAINFLI
ncbi:Tigger transposable element-derived protein 6 [Dictyocoela muelleri]|nr:Tigger transposable element-derived protein 6 [Dictyocoela muelleri]